MRILLAEDDSRVAGFVRRGLREEQYAVDVAADGEKALFMAQTGAYDLIILDLMLPKQDGMEVLRNCWPGSGHFLDAAGIWSRPFFPRPTWRWIP